MHSIWENILEFVSDYNDIKSLCLTCKWLNDAVKHYITACKTEKDVILPMTKLLHLTCMTDNFVKRNSFNLISLILPNITMIDVTYLLSLTRLRKIDLSCIKIVNIHRFLPRTLEDITIYYLESIKKFPKLKSLRIWYRVMNLELLKCPELNYLDINSMINEKTLMEMKNLKHYCNRSLYNYEGRIPKNIIDLSIKSRLIDNFHSNLINLELDGNFMTDTYIKNLPQLEKLILPGSTKLSNKCFKDLPRTLKHLSIPWGKFSREHFDQLPNLTTLELPGSYLSPDCLEYLPKSLINLKIMQNYYLDNRRVEHIDQIRMSYYRLPPNLKEFNVPDEYFDYLKDDDLFYLPINLTVLKIGAKLNNPDFRRFKYLDLLNLYHNVDSIQLPNLFSLYIKTDSAIVFPLSLTNLEWTTNNFNVFSIKELKLKFLTVYGKIYDADIPFLPKTLEYLRIPIATKLTKKCVKYFPLNLCYLEVYDDEQYHHIPELSKIVNGFLSYYLFPSKKYPNLEIRIRSPGVISLMKKY